MILIFHYSLTCTISDSKLCNCAHGNLCRSQLAWDWSRTEPWSRCRSRRLAAFEQKDRHSCRGAYTEKSHFKNALWAALRSKNVLRSSNSACIMGRFTHRVIHLKLLIKVLHGGPCTFFCYTCSLVQVWNVCWFASLLELYLEVATEHIVLWSKNVCLAHRTKCTHLVSDG